MVKTNGTPRLGQKCRRTTFVTGGGGRGGVKGKRRNPFSIF